MRRLIVREIAQAKGLSMAGLQREAHLDRHTAQRVWNNPFRTFFLTTLEKIAKALDVPVDDLYVEVGEDEVLVSPPPPAPPLMVFSPPLAEEDAEQQAKILKALAEPARLWIVSRLHWHEGQFNVKELVSAYITPTLSNHLRTLRVVGLTSRLKDQQGSYYYLNRECIRTVGDFLMHTLLAPVPTDETGPHERVNID